MLTASVPELQQLDSSPQPPPRGTSLHLCTPAYASGWSLKIPPQGTIKATDTKEGDRRPEKGKGTPQGHTGTRTAADLEPRHPDSLPSVPHTLEAAGRSLNPGEIVGKNAAGVRLPSIRKCHISQR